MKERAKEREGKIERKRKWYMLNGKIRWPIYIYYAPSSIFRDPPFLSKENQWKKVYDYLNILILYDNLLQSCECIKTKKRIMKIPWYKPSWWHLNICIYAYVHTCARMNIGLMYAHVHAHAHVRIYARCLRMKR